MNKSILVFLCLVACALSAQAAPSRMLRNLPVVDSGSNPSVYSPGTSSCPATVEAVLLANLGVHNGTQNQEMNHPIRTCIFTIERQAAPGTYKITVDMMGSTPTHPIYFPDSDPYAWMITDTRNEHSLGAPEIGIGLPPSLPYDPVTLKIRAIAWSFDDYFYECMLQ